MDAIEALLTRNTVAIHAQDELPKQDIEALLKAAVRAPDHAWLRPWRFSLIQGEKRRTISERIAEEKANSDPDFPQSSRQKLAKIFCRSPLVIMVSVHPVTHPKVPVMDQWLSAGAACQNILLAAHALGYSAIWRTGEIAECAVAHQALGLPEGSGIAGFLYIGKANTSEKQLPSMDTAQYLLEIN